MYSTMRKSILVAAAIAAGQVATVDAQADVAMRCGSVLCGRTTYDGSRVTIYLNLAENRTFTHYNFKTNPGDQIELGPEGIYSFDAEAEHTGTYSAQICSRGSGGFRSVCSGWTRFSWNSFR